MSLKENAMHEDPITQAANETQTLLGPDEGVTVIWPQNADALRKGPEGLLLSAAVTDRCDGCGQTVPFVAERIEGEFRNGHLWTAGTYSRQHGCGTWAPPIVEVAVDGDSLDDLDLSGPVAQLRAKVREAQTERRETLRSDLATALAEARAERPTTPESDDPGAWRDWRQSHHVSPDNSGSDGPIFEAADGTLTAWAVGPAGDDDIEVS